MRIASVEWRTKPDGGQLEVKVELDPERGAVRSLELFAAASDDNPRFEPVARLHRPPWLFRWRPRPSPSVLVVRAHYRDGTRTTSAEVNPG